MPLMHAQNISYHYGAETVFAHASFALEPGDRVGLIGPNGSGKSTLMRLLLDEDQPTAGEIARTKVELLRWLLPLMVGQVVAIAALVKLL